MFKSYGFRFADRYPDLMLIETIGHEIVTDEAYNWDGRTRRTNGYLFQYTLAGSGKLEWGGNLFEVKKHQAFIVEIPGEHRYYYDPDTNEPWEVIWVRLRGRHIEPYWNILKSNGNILQLHGDSGPVSSWWQLFRDTIKGKMDDPYIQSVRVYEWLLSFLRETQQGHEAVVPSGKGNLYAASIAWMRERYGSAISLEQLADIEKLSKSHYCKSFHRALGISPIDYLNRVRVEESARLLTGSTLTIAQIAAVSGFETASYFGKVFKRYVGMPPHQFREGGHDWHVDLLKLL